MQNLPVILAVFVAAAAIILVLFWRIKPQPVTGTRHLEKRIEEELETVRLLRAKLNDTQGEMRKAEFDVATARASSQAADGKALAAEQKLKDAEALCVSLQEKINQFGPSLATAQSEKNAAITAKAELTARHDALSVRSDALQNDLNEALSKVATAEADASHKQTRIDEMTEAVGALQSSLTLVRGELVEAVTKQQSDEAAASHFKVISQEILNGTLAEAKRGVEELAAAFQKSSGAELDKHAQKITQTLEPLQDRLLAYDAAVAGLKKDTQENYGSLRHHLDELQKTERSLHDQAKALTTALSSSPKVKGNYGELVLKQLVEFVGMQEKYHFEPQASRDTEEGRKIPDLVVSLPGGQKVLVDAKAVMDACVQAHQAQDDASRLVLIKKHCENVRSRVADLSSKNYFMNHHNAVDVVILFLPAENLYATALENDAELTEFAMRRKVILCGPNSLMMLLKVANQLWQRASIEEEAEKIKQCGDAIYKFACDFVDKYAKLGTKIRQLENDYNDAAGTLDARLIPKGRDMGRLAALANGREMEDIPKLTPDVREFRSVEAKKRIAGSTPTLLGLVVGDETSELTFSAGEEQ